MTNFKRKADRSWWKMRNVIEDSDNGPPSHFSSLFIYIWDTAFVQMKMVIVLFKCQWCMYWCSLTSRHALRHSSVPYVQCNRDHNMLLLLPLMSTDVQHHNMTGCVVCYSAYDGLQTWLMSLSGVAVHFGNINLTKCICCWTSLYMSWSWNCLYQLDSDGPSALERRTALLLSRHHRTLHVLSKFKQWLFHGRHIIFGISVVL